MDLAELFAQGGPLMWVILAASVVGVGVFFERLWSTQRAKVLPRSFVDRIKALQGKDGILSVSVIHGFMAADVPEVGTRILVVSDGDKAKGDRENRRQLLERGKARG